MRNSVRKLIFAILIFISLLAIGNIMFGTPLVESGDYRVSVTVDGSPVRSELLRPFPAGSYYIHLIDQPAGRYRWFGVDFGRKSVFIPVAAPRSRYGFFSLNADQDKGVDLTDGKIEDRWNVHFTATGVSFENASIGIQFIQKKKR